MAYTGGVLLINGTAVVTVYTKPHTAAYNTTEAEVEAVTPMGKQLQWLRIFLDDMGLPYDQPIFISEGDLAARTIANAGKLTHNVRRIATKTTALQEHVL